MTNATKDQELARIASLETMPCTDAAAPLRDLMLNFSRVRLAVMDRYPHLTADDVDMITGRVIEQSLGI